MQVVAVHADTFPNTVLEALACGTPVAATAVGGILEQVEDGVTGFLVPPGNTGAMAQAVVTLLDHEVLRQRLAENAAADACQRFGLNRAVDDYIDFYRGILENWQHANRSKYLTC